MTQGILKANSIYAIPEQVRKKFVSLGIFYEDSADKDYEARQLEASIVKHRADIVQAKTYSNIPLGDRLVMLIKESGTKGDVLVVSKDFYEVPEYIRRNIQGFKLFEVYVARSKKRHYQRLLKKS